MPCLSQRCLQITEPFACGCFHAIKCNPLLWSLAGIAQRTLVWQAPRQRYLAWHINAQFNYSHFQLLLNNEHDPFGPMQIFMNAQRRRVPTSCVVHLTSGGYCGKEQIQYRHPPSSSAIFLWSKNVLYCKSSPSWFGVNSGLNCVTSPRVELTLQLWNCFSFHIVDSSVICSRSTAAGTQSVLLQPWKLCSLLSFLLLFFLPFSTPYLRARVPRAILPAGVQPRPSFISIALQHKTHDVCISEDTTTMHLSISAVWGKCWSALWAVGGCTPPAEKCWLICICC